MLPSQFTKMLRVLDLFSGIGGFSLGLERAGMRTVAFCEIDPYCRAVLRKHWPGVPCHDDVRTFAGVECDVICGGFPCQDISIAGKGAGIDGKRSGLWVEFARLIGSLRPQYAIVENVSVLLARGLDRVLGDLAEIGYDAEWYCIPASAVGAPHERDRLWIVAYPHHGQRLGSQGQAGRDAAGPGGEAMADADREPGHECRTGDAGEGKRGRHAGRGGIGADVAHAQGEPERPRLRESIAAELWRRRPGNRGGAGKIWSSEPDVGRVANGVPARVDRLTCLGNAVVPEIPEIIGAAILEFESVL